MVPLSRRLHRLGHRPLFYRYPTVRRGVEENADGLWRFLCGRFGPGMVDAPEGGVHLVGHSLGGLVALTGMVRHPEARLGRMVALGTPFLGSGTALGLARWRPGRLLLGDSLRQALAGGGPARVPPGREIGIIAGSRSLGVSAGLWSLPRPNDGTVAVAETRLPGAAHLTRTHSHMGLVFSRSVPPLIDRFLRTGRFDVGVSDDGE